MSSILSNTGHKVACRALYKAFLTSCKRLPDTNNMREDATRLIKKEFKKNKRVYGVKDIQKILVVAYGHEQILRTATDGDPSCLEAVHRYLKKAAEQSARGPPRPKPADIPPPQLTRLEKARIKKEKRKAKRLEMLKQSTPEGELPPLKVRKGPRIWQPKRYLFPVLAYGNSFPVLRRKGTPTPPHIAMIIKKQLQVKQKRQDLQDLMHEHLEYARGEDLWDEQISRQLRKAGFGDGLWERGEGSWEDVIKLALRDTAAALRKREVLSKALADRFYEIELKGRRKLAMIVAGRRRERRKRQRRNRWEREVLMRRMERGAQSSKEVEGAATWDFGTET